MTEPNGKITSYSFDKAGNRKTEIVIVGENLTGTSYIYNEQNRLISSETKLSDKKTEKTIYEYDNNGNLKSKTKSIMTITDANTPTDIQNMPSFELEIIRSTDKGSGSQDLTLYSYDNFNRLIMLKEGSTTSTYNYNAQDYRVEKTVGNNTTLYLYEADKVILETDSTGNQLAKNVYGTTLLYRLVEENGTSPEEEYYYMYNAHGDVTALISPNGEVKGTYDYDAFGNIISKTGDVNNNITYAGYQYDKETDLYYVNARYYDSKIARFITEDTYTGNPNDPLSLNLYTYCVNNPIRYWDPSGYYVSPTDQANLTASQIKQLEQLTKDWNAANAAGNIAAMKAANEAANAIRTSAGYSGGGNGNSIIVSSGNTTKTVIVNDTTTVSNSGTIVTVNVLTGATSAITNSGTIGTVNNSGTINYISNISSGTVGTINNSGSISYIYNTGTIANISNIVNGSIGTITNINTIGNISTGKSTSNINNTGVVSNIFTGSNSIVKVNNTGIINRIYVGSGGKLNGTNDGFVVNISGGTSYMLTNQWIDSSAKTLLLIQNQFILNYLLTKDEQNAGVGASRIGGKLYRDISTPVENALLRDVGDFESHSGKNFWFRSKVGNEGVWNLKYREGDVNHWEQTLGIPFWGYSTQMVLNGKLVTVEQVGNITYGYLAAAAGMSQSWMKFGSSVNHFLKHGFKNWDNEKADKLLFELGINWYNEGVIK
ncbi:RHS repeat-associated core domain-containing protein [Sedimentibacter sp. zth1]|uniref:RHS repeat-associated core domain-containing protein n=1 Tax=Sedimentibacter sp. zth1 TaxID=2816908 RepID=UPI001F5FA9D2